MCWATDAGGAAAATAAATLSCTPGELRFELSETLPLLPPPPAGSPPDSELLEPPPLLPDRLPRPPPPPLPRLCCDCGVLVLLL